MPLTQDDLWRALEAIGTEDDEADKIAPTVIAKLIDLRFVELTATGLPQLTDKGEHALVVLESGDGNVPAAIDVVVCHSDHWMPTCSLRYGLCWAVFYGRHGNFRCLRTVRQYLQHPLRQVRHTV